ncbi:NAD-dependent epimerase/dehydratase family protein [Halovenus sp. WSH3]|uniref:NAD-dependent epimerase/dehydratase family protein n=1 Tax=Halovenus carboxidivorans TaxID=2692199 RepID=A0A6B0TDB1_9EURY|nr:NAD-dependent epimerase/dehydratase family protein [Halovenus carboxidivorans]MXR51189.1 NAD-dependent epimerase/dehydratase family protein [Halovenus carboxidivorans]
MDDALIIGGTRFIGRHLVDELLDAEYDVTLFNRGTRENPFADHNRVDHYTGDRTSGAALKEANEAVEPDLVVDCVAYYPGEVKLAVEAFEDVEAYVYVSSGAVYEPDVIPKREGETPLEPCSGEQAVDDSHESYGPRKAEGDRIVFEAAENGVNAMSVRPTIVYGPHDYTGRYQYWVDRISEYDRVLVPGDGTNIHHLVSVYNTVRAIRAVGENGTPGEAYNAGDHRVLTLQDLLEETAEAVGTDPEFVEVNDRELATAGLESTEFPLYNPDVHVLSTAKLADIGWEPLSPREAIERTVAWSGEPERDPGPDRETEEQVLDSL